MNETAKIPDIVLPYPQAADLVARHARMLLPDTVSAQIEQVALLDALGRVLAEPLHADRDQPPFPRSTRDGFACRAADLAGRASLPVDGLLRAGEATTDTRVAAGRATEIMTGAPLPAGADCVVMLEHVEHAHGAIRLAGGRTIEPGANVVPAGAETRAGAEVLPAGLRMAPHHVGAAASCGHALVKVRKRPRVAILATGDELVAIDTTPEPHQIRNSNSYSLAAQVMAAGGMPVIQPTAQDGVDSLRGSVEEALDCDLLILSGGVSKGKYDFVKPVMGSLGAEFLMTGAEIQPGKPVVMGRLPAGESWRYFFGLPGNPVSTLVTFALFARPLVAALAGERGYAPRFLEARMAREFRTRPGLTRFLPAIVTANGMEMPTVEPVAWQGSGDLAATARANGYFVVPPDVERLTAGEVVRVLVE